MTGDRRVPRWSSSAADRAAACAPAAAIDRTDDGTPRPPCPPSWEDLASQIERDRPPRPHLFRKNAENFVGKVLLSQVHSLRPGSVHVATYLTRYEADFVMACYRAREDGRHYFPARRYGDPRPTRFVWQIRRADPVLFGDVQSRVRWMG